MTVFLEINYYNLYFIVKAIIIVIISSGLEINIALLIISLLVNNVNSHVQ